MPQIMKLFVSSENRIAKDKNGEKLPWREVTEQSTSPLHSC